MSREDFLTAPTAGSGLEAFGIDRVLWPEAQLAADIERVVTTPGAIDAEVFAGGVVRLLEYRLEAGVAAGRRRGAAGCTCRAGRSSSP